MAKLRSLNSVANEEYLYQQKIYNNEIIPCDTGFRFLNDRLLKGTNKEDVILLAGLSGVGKSTLAIQLAYNLATLNKKTRCLYLSFEVPGRKIAAKLVGKDLNLSLNQLYSNGLVDKSNFDKFKNIPFDIIEVPIDVTVIANVLQKYSEKHPLERVHIFFDHTLLVSGRQGDNENDTLIALSKLVNIEKKNYDRVFFLISQLNNSMLDPKRMVYKGGHYPNQTDIFGSKYLYHVANNVLAIVNPSALNLPSDSYGPNNLPFKIESKTKGEVRLFYIHTIKARDGVPGLDPLIDRLETNSLEEFSIKGRENFFKKYNV